MRGSFHLAAYRRDRAKVQPLSWPGRFDGTAGPNRWSLPREPKSPFSASRRTGRVFQALEPKPGDATFSARHQWYKKESHARCRAKLGGLSTRLGAPGQPRCGSRSRTSSRRPKFLHKLLMPDLFGSVSDLDHEIGRTSAARSMGGGCGLVNAPDRLNTVARQCPSGDVEKRGSSTAAVSDAQIQIRCTICRTARAPTRIRAALRPYSIPVGPLLSRGRFNECIATLPS